MERTPAQPTFADAFAADLGGPRTAASLARCQALVPRGDPAASIAHPFPAQPEGGRPFRPAVRMPECVMPQKSGTG